MDQNQPDNTHAAAMLGVLSESMPVMLVYIDRDERYRYINRMYQEWIGLTHERILGRRVEEVVAPQTYASLKEKYRRIFAGETIRDDVTVHRSDGQERTMAAVWAPDAGPDGRVRGFVVAGVDVTERRQSERELVLLARAGEIFAEQMEYADALRAVQDLLVPALADSCVIDLRNGASVPLFAETAASLAIEEPIGWLAVAHADPDKAAIVRELIEKYPFPSDSPLGPQRVMRTRQPEVVSEIDDAFLVSIAQDERHLELLRAIGMRSVVSVPLIARGHAVGALTLIGGKSRRRYQLADVPFVRTLATRAALAIENTLLRRRSEVIEERFRQTIEQVEDYAIFSVDLEGRCTTWNEGVGAVLGYQRDEFIGMSVQRVFTPEAVRSGAMGREFEEAASGAKSSSNDRWMVRKDGSHFWASGITTGLRDEGGRVTGFTKVMRDLTERRISEDRVRESERRFRLMADAAPVLIWVSDSTGACTWFNKVWHEFTGRTPAQEYGEGWAQGVHPEDREACFRAYREALSRRKPYEMEFRLKRRDGEYRWLLVRAEPYDTAPEEFGGFVGASTDITDAKQAAESLRKHAAALTLSNENLLQYASAASHDLKEPLRGISRLASFIAEDEKHLGKAAQERLGRIRMLCERLTVMVSGLIEHARAGGEINRVRCDLNDVVHHVLDSSAEQFELQGGEVRIIGTLPVVRADCALMERVFANLIANGIKFNRSEGKRVEIFWVPPSEPKGAPAGAVAVRDNGIGIDPRHHAKVFDLFRRLHQPDEYSGAGLGLALATRIVAAHGGTIDLESAPGKGSTFYIRLPVGDGLVPDRPEPAVQINSRLDGSGVPRL